MAFRSGFVAIIGKPNVGKSTLLNSIVGDKLAIVTDKPQTTRNRITGVLTRPEGQVIFVDTPGFHKPLHRLGEYMVEIARQTLAEVDAVLVILDAVEGIRPSDRHVIRELSGISVPKLAVINKIDLVADGEVIQELEAELRGLERSMESRFERVVAVSALSGQGVEELVQAVINLLPPGPKYYPDDWISDQPERFVVAEFIREKILLLTREEVPHSVAIEIESMSKRDERDLVDIRATIFVERESQKGIVIGRGGAMLRRIGEQARMDIERILGSQVNLELWVKVRKDWRRDDTALRQFGYE